MKISAHALALAGATLLLSGSITSAQERDALVDVDVSAERHRWLVGVTGSFSSNYHTGGFRTVPGRDDMPIFESGTGGGVQIGIVGEHVLTPIMSIDMRAVYDARPAAFIAPVPTVLVLIPGTQNVVTAEPDTMLHAEVDYRLVSAELMMTGRVLRFSPDLYLSLSVGPAIGYVTGASITQWSEPTGGGERTYYRQDEEMSEREGMRLSMKGGAGLDWRLSDRIWTHARVHYDYGLTDVTSSENWQLNSIVAQLDFLYAL